MAPAKVLATATTTVRARAIAARHTIRSEFQMLPAMGAFFCAQAKSTSENAFREALRFKTRLKGENQSTLTREKLLTQVK
ncbi:MAG: hypothetical protein ACI4BI_02945 [Anaerotardibacter sp.]